MKIILLGGGMVGQCYAQALQAQGHTITAFCDSAPSEALHALAGRSLARQWPVRGNTATTIADALPHVFHTISQDQEDDLAWPG